MINNNEIITIKLLDREYQIKCPIEKTAELQEAAQYLNTKLLKDHESSKKTFNLEPMFMITALNLSYDFLDFKKKQTLQIEQLTLRLQEIQNKIEHALAQ